MFAALYGLDFQAIPEADLWIWKEPLAPEVCNFVWDTRVPEVTDPWPSREILSIGDAVSRLSPAVTAVLREQTQYLEVIDDVRGA